MTRPGFGTRFGFFLQTLSPLPTLALIVHENLAFARHGLDVGLGPETNTEAHWIFLSFAALAGLFLLFLGRRVSAGWHRRAGFVTLILLGLGIAQGAIYQVAISGFSVP